MTHETKRDEGFTCVLLLKVPYDLRAIGKLECTCVPLLKTLLPPVSFHQNYVRLPPFVTSDRRDSAHEMTILPFPLLLVMCEAHTSWVSSTFHLFLPPSLRHG
jgi:hypothetical protein